MLNLILFLVGAVIGTVVFNIAYFAIINHVDKKEYKKFKKRWDDPSTEEFLYDENGEKIWSNKKGCIGPATYIK